MPRRSTGTYPPDWRAIAMAAKESAEWRCVRCGHKHDPVSGHTLTVHHLDLDPSNCRWWNLAPLCQRCHLHIQAKVVMERPYLFDHTAWFKPYVAGRYAYELCLPDRREYVHGREDEIIARWRAEQGMVG